MFCIFFVVFVRLKVINKKLPFKKPHFVSRLLMSRLRHSLKYISVAFGPAKSTDCYNKTIAAVDSCRWPSWIKHLSCINQSSCHVSCFILKSLLVFLVLPALIVPSCVLLSEVWRFIQSPLRVTVTIWQGHDNVLSNNSED